jgi:hypothetical protein
MSRRSFVKALAVSAMSSSVSNPPSGRSEWPRSGAPAEWSYTSGKQYSDPFNQVDVDAIITLPSGQQERMPAFWAGGSDMARALRAARPGSTGFDPFAATPKTATFMIVPRH